MSWQSTISIGSAIYSVPSILIDERVWARVDGLELVVVHGDRPEGPREFAPACADDAGPAEHPQ